MSRILPKEEGQEKKNCQVQSVGAGQAGEAAGASQNESRVESADGAREALHWGCMGQCCSKWGPTSASVGRLVKMQTSCSPILCPQQQIVDLTHFLFFLG